MKPYHFAMLIIIAATSARSQVSHRAYIIQQDTMESIIAPTNMIEYKTRVETGIRRLADSIHAGLISDESVRFDPEDDVLHLVGSDSSLDKVESALGAIGLLPWQIEFTCRLMDNSASTGGLCLVEASVVAHSGVRATSKCVSLTEDGQQDTTLDVTPTFRPERRQIQVCVSFDHHSADADKANVVDIKYETALVLMPGRPVAVTLPSKSSRRVTLVMEAHIVNAKNRRLDTSILNTMENAERSRARAEKVSRPAPTVAPEEFITIEN